MIAFGMDKKFKYGDRYDSFLKEAAAFRGKIVALYQNGNGVSQSDLARKFGVTRQRINQIVAPIKNKARQSTKTAVRLRKIPHPSTLKCVDCGAKANSYDHRDYKKPLKVDPVCMPCNRKRGRGKNSNG